MHQRASAGLLLTLSGCVALSGVQPADTLGRGRVQVGIEPGVSTFASRGPILPQPLADVSVRYGALERLDLGARLGQSGLEVMAKVMLTPRRWPVLLSVAPALQGTLLLAGDPAPRVVGHGFGAALPLLVGVRLGAHQLVLGPRAHVLVTSGPDGGLRALLVGGTVGLALRVSRAVVVLPELAVLPPVLRSAPFPTALPGITSTDGLPLQLRLGLLLGEAEPRDGG